MVGCDGLVKAAGFLVRDGSSPSSYHCTRVRIDQDPTSTITSPEWLPFDPPSQSSQVDQLTRRLTDPRNGAPFLRSFFQMITLAIETMSYAAPDFAAYLISIFGKLLTLANVDFGLQLATAPLRSQVVASPPSSLGLAIPTEPEPLLSYKFPIKIGDVDRPFSGVVGFLDNVDGIIDWEELHTCFTSQQQRHQSKRIHASLSCRRISTP